ncbi:MAG: NAD-dependent epimerase/dehydratase family protein [Promethearchaeota archaeon]
MKIQGWKVLITGVAGFIGSNLADNLLALGAEVIGIDNLYNGTLENIDEALKNKNFQFHKVDVRDFDFILEICKGVEIIFHEAAFASVPKSLKMPSSCNDVNINGILNILNSARKLDIEKVIFASSSSVYGNQETLPMVETMQRNPISPYGAAKLACEAYMQSYYHSYGIKTVSLRYFNVFGPRQKVSDYSGVISKWLGRIINNEPLIIYGDGTQTRDFTYIKDVVQANILAAEKNISGEIINIGAGNPITINELATIMLKLSNRNDIQIIKTDPRHGDIKHGYADTTKAKEILDFIPKYNQEQGIAEYFQWYSKRYNVNLTN